MDNIENQKIIDLKKRIFDRVEKCGLNMVSEKFYSPITEEIIHDKIIGSNPGKKIDKKEIFKIVDNYCNDLWKLHFNKNVDEKHILKYKDTYKYCMDVVELVIRKALYSDVINGISSNNLIDGLIFISEKIKNSFVSAGMMVGIDAGYQLVERVMQFTLDIFHHSGEQAETLQNRSNLDNLLKLTNLSSEKKGSDFQVMKIIPREKYNNKYDINTIFNKFKPIFLNEQIKSIKIYIDDDTNPQNTKIGNDSVWIKDFYKHSLIDVPKNLDNQYIRIEIDKYKKMENYLEISEIALKLEETFDNIIVIYSSPLIDYPVLRIYENIMNTVKESKRKPLSYVVKNINETKIIIRGIERINRISIQKENIHKLLPDGKIDFVERYYIITDGSNFNALYNFIDYIDISQCWTNHIDEMIENFGYEATKHFVISQIIKIYKDSDFYINYGHFHTLISMMGFKSFLTSTTYKGLKNGDYSPIERIFFEQHKKGIRKAMLYNEVDNCNSVDACMFTGNKINGGSNMCDIYYDPHHEEKEDKEFEEEFL